MTGSDPVAAGMPEARLRLLVPTLVFVGLLVAIVSSLGAPLVPTIAQVDHVSLSSAQWVLTAALLTGALATPVMGPRPVREVFAGMGVPEEILAEQERMDAILPAWVWEIDSKQLALSDKSDWEDEEI